MRSSAAAIACELAATPREVPDLAEACRAAWAEHRYALTHAAFCGLVGLGSEISTSATATVNTVALPHPPVEVLNMAGGHQHGARAADAISDLLGRVTYTETTGKLLAMGPSLRDIDRAFANHALFICAYLMKSSLLAIASGGGDAERSLAKVPEYIERLSP